jgi:hypothetical protein
MEDPAALFQLEEAYAATLDELVVSDDVGIPPFKQGAALGALRCMYRICHALVDRALPAVEVEAIFSTMPPAPTDAGDILSADLVLRHLPWLYLWAKSLSENDPLFLGMPALAVRFPLSSVGMGALPEPIDISSLKRHKSLWKLYVDRVMERQDDSRLSDPEVNAAVRNALGTHASLSPRMAVAVTA